MSGVDLSGFIACLGWGCVYLYIKRFLVAGAINTLFAYLLLAVFLFFGAHYTLATFMAGVLPILSGYFLHKNYVFLSNKGNFYLYVAIFSVIYLSNISIQYVFLLFYDNGYFAGLFSTVICCPLSFCLMKYSVFSSE